VFPTQKKEKRERENIFPKIKRFLKKLKKKKGEPITLHKGKFHLSLHQN